MELSQQIKSSHTTPSPSGKYCASVTITTNSLRICTTHAPEQCTDVPLRASAKDITGLKWNDESDGIAIVSPNSVEVIDLDDASHRIRLDNGTGGFGRFTGVEFVGSEHLLVVWEFGKAKVWDLTTGKGVEIGDVKSACDGRRWQLRPGSSTATARRTLAVLSRMGADDVLNLYFPALLKQVASVRLPTADAQSISWSPDGRWLAVLDTATAFSHIHFLTPDGHLFRSYPSICEGDTLGLGIRAAIWAGDSKTVALTRFDGRIILLNTRTFVPRAIIEHTTTIDQSATATAETQAPIWQEALSASGDRSYTKVAQPFSPPLSRTKPTTEPIELGVAEAEFSCDGSWLATRDERMLNTVWIWNMTTLGAHVVLVQHSTVRRVQWDPKRPDELLFDCGEGVAYLFSASSPNPPTPVSLSMTGAASPSWLHSTANANPSLLAASKSIFRMLYPAGRPEQVERFPHGNNQEADDEAFDEGASEDSLFDVLSGRKPLPPKTEQSYTERVDFEVAATDDDTDTLGIDDTFREKRSRKPLDVDPLDDSDIF